MLINIYIDDELPVGRQINLTFNRPDIFENYSYDKNFNFGSDLQVTLSLENMIYGIDRASYVGGKANLGSSWSFSLDYIKECVMRCGDAVSINLDNKVYDWPFGYHRATPQWYYADANNIKQITVPDTDDPDIYWPDKFFPFSPVNKAVIATTNEGEIIRWENYEMTYLAQLLNRKEDIRAHIINSQLHKNGDQVPFIRTEFQVTWVLSSSTNCETVFT